MDSESIKGSQINMKMCRIFVLCFLSLMSLSAVAAQFTMSAQWTGNEDVIEAFQGSCNGAGNLAYHAFNPIQTSESGEYRLADASDNLPGDLVVAIYAGEFDPANAEANQILTTDQGTMVTLSGGQDYTVVAQHFCSNTPSATFAVSLSGPGIVSGMDVVESGDWAVGNLNGSAPFASFSGINQEYALSSPVTVPVTGLYTFSEVSLFTDLDMVLRVYEESFNPADTAADLVVQHDDSGGLVLRTGVEYRFVVTAKTPGNTGQWEWVMFPPGPFQLNEGLGGAWYNPATSGQGVLLDFMTDIEMAYLAWFTFDLQTNTSNTTPMIGSEGHRWLTANGHFEAGESAVLLDVLNTSGGVFDSVDPPVVNQAGYGSVELEFSDCLNGTLKYDIPAGPVSGDFPITRASYDHLSLCAHLASTGPGVITD